VNVVEFIRFAAMLILAGTLFRLVELRWGGQPGVLGSIATGLGVIY
jgi:hypothetical protein